MKTFNRSYLCKFLLLLILAVSNQSSAKNNLIMKREGPSTSCYVSIGPKFSKAWVIEISMETLLELSKEHPSISALADNIITVLKQEKLKSAAILYDHDRCNKGKEQDCRLYALKSQGVIDRNTIIRSRYTLYPIRDPAFLVSFVTEKIDEENNARMSLTYFPKWQLSKIKMAKNFGLSYVIVNSPIVKNMLLSPKNPDAKYWRDKFLAYPVVDYRIEKGDTLWGIAIKCTDDETSWPSMWALNSDRMPEAIHLKPGRKIVYPAPIRQWVTVKYTGTDPLNLSYKMYQTNKLSGLIEKIYYMTASPSDPSYCLLPDFGKFDSIRDIYFGHQWINIDSIPK